MYGLSREGCVCVLEFGVVVADGDGGYDGGVGVVVGGSSVLGCCGC